jgi:hypothetical protein
MTEEKATGKRKKNQKENKIRSEAAAEEEATKVSGIQGQCET